MGNFCKQTKMGCTLGEDSPSPRKQGNVRANELLSPAKGFREHFFLSLRKLGFRLHKTPINCLLGGGLPVDCLRIAKKKLYCNDGDGKRLDVRCYVGIKNTLGYSLFFILVY